MTGTSGVMSLVGIIPVAGIKAVGQSFVFCILADVILTVLHYAL